jgi:hypothetical protein
MFRSIVRAAVALAATTAVAFAPSVAQAAPTVEAAPVAVRAAPQVATPRLVDVRFARHRTFDRLVFDFRNGTPDVEARFVRVVRDEDTGRRVFIPGRAFLLLQFDPARARNFPRGTQFTEDLRNVRGFRLVGNDDNTVTIALGLRNRVGVRVFELSDRIVVDVANRRLR